MKRYLSIFFSMIIFWSCESTTVVERPNVVLIFADDLGYGEVGAYGQTKIKTPHMDALAESGMLFSQFYSAAPVCAPARFMLLTGKHAGHAAIRGNDEWSERGDVWDYEAASKDAGLEGQRPMPPETVTLPELLKDSGYRTGMFGKWGLGGPTSESVPTKEGFDVFYGYNCQRQAHNLYPPHLWDNELKDFLDNDLIAPRTKIDSLADPLDPDSYVQFFQEDYAPAKMHDRALKFIADSKEGPFFMYYASPLPHLPLQVPREYIEPYINQFGDEEPYLGDRGYFPTRYPRATYAGMISYLDAQVGELVQKLKDEGVYENTVIIFTSDNGPTYAGGVDFEFFESSGPLSNGYGRTKGFVYEGGVRVPFIASWPGKIEAESTSDHVGILYDLLPTICEIAGATIPQDIDGIGMSGALSGSEQTQHEFLFWDYPEYKGQQAVRMGNWKGIRKNMHDGNLTIELYDLESDIQEQNDVAAQNPQIVEKIKLIMEREHSTAENPRFRFEVLGESK